MAASITASSRDLPLRPRTPSPEPFAFRALAWSTLALTAAVLSASVALVPAALDIHPALFAAWTVLVALVGGLSVSFGPGTEMTLDLPVLLAAAYLFGPAIAGLMAFLGSIEGRELKRQVSLLTALFNHAQVSLSVMAAGYVFSLAAGDGKSGSLLLVPAFLGLVADSTLNIPMAAAAVALKQRVPWRQALRGLKFGRPLPFVVMYLGFGFSAVVLVTAYRGVGPWALAEFLIPLLLVGQVFRYGTRLDAQVQEVQRAHRALTDVTTTIAEERRDERARIAAALHDEVQQALYNATLHAEVIREELKSGRLLALEDDIPRLLEANQSARSMLREVIRDLTRSEFGVGGLASTLRLLVSDVPSSWGGRIEAHVEEAGGTPEVQLLVYQIAREALHNAVRHSHGSTIKLKLSREREHINLLVADDGQGFAVDAVDPDQHFGLEIMRERAYLAGGTVEIDSRPGEGTKVIGLFPVGGRRTGDRWNARD